MQKLQTLIDKVSIAISALLLTLMIIILTANVILRYIPGIGGFKWYMESSQYLNVWAMFIAGIAICVNTEHLSVNILENALKGIGKKMSKILVAAFTVLFYIGLAYATFLLASKSKQDISTMAPLKMAYVYWLIPVVSILSAASTLIGLMVDLSQKDKNEGGAKT